MDIELLATDDGSHTIRNKLLNATYHSKHGAINESRHIYIEAGLHHVLKQFGKSEALNILEIGFGTGLNALLTLKEALEKELQINYVSIEKEPIPIEIVNELNYPHLLGFDNSTIFSDLHTKPWNQSKTISANFSIEKRLSDINQFYPDKEFHLIYFDAFAPANSPDMWHPDIFKKLYQNLIPNGCLLSFCAQGEFKRLLKARGFKVESLPGPKGKREITRASK